MDPAEIGIAAGHPALRPDARDRLLSGLADAADCLMAAFDDASLALREANEATKRWLRLADDRDPAEVTLLDIVGVADLERFQNEIIRHVRIAGRWQGECELRDAWGSETFARVTLVRLAATSERGACLGLTAIRLGGKAEMHALYDRELLQALLETVPDVIYFKDTESRFLRLSRAMRQRFGEQTADALIGKTDFDVYAADHAQKAYADERRILATGEPITDFEEKETWPDGRVTWVSTSKFPLRDSEGRIVGTFGISRDTTASKRAEAERREMEAKLALAQKLESIGRLAAGIAHEINTPTQYITDNVRFASEALQAMIQVIVRRRKLLDEAPTSGMSLDAVREALNASEAEHEIDYYIQELPATLTQTAEGLERISRIVRSLKEFSHPNNAHRGSTDLARAIETAVAVSRHEWKYVADVTTELDPNMPPVPCILDEVNQVMLNLIINAAQAIAPALKQRGEERGRIVVRTSHTDTHAIIEVSDNGVGIPPEHRQRVFEPFFTTKELGKGTGQGLGIVHTVVVKHHGGTVDFTTEVGVGTTFRIQLPLHRPEEHNSHDDEDPVR